MFKEMLYALTFLTHNNGKYFKKFIRILQLTHDCMYKFYFPLFQKFLSLLITYFRIYLTSRGLHLSM